MTEQALSGTRVLDLSHLIAGPYCTKILAGFGAEVTKIEKPGLGDRARSMGPFLGDEPGVERSGLFLYLNGNKKSVTLNLKSKAGVKLFKEMVREADVVVESFRPGVMAELGLDYPTLERINPRIVMTSISNFGQSGPYRDYKSTHIVNWSMSGARYANGLPGRRPLQSGGWLTHYIAGLYGVVATAVALFHRNETGAGQCVDVSMFESMMMMPPYPCVYYSYLGDLHNASGRALLGIFPCKDGYVGVNFLTQFHWEMMCAFFGMPELLKDPRFEVSLSVKDHVEEAAAIFAPLIKEREKDELFASGVEWRVPIGLIPTTREILDSPQHKARGFFEEVEHPVMGRATMPGAPFKMSETPWQNKNPAPRLGEHNGEVYRNGLGYSRDDLVRLRQQGVI